MKQPDFDSKAIFRRLVSYVAKHKLIFLFAVIAMVITALAHSYFAVLIKDILDEGFINANPWYLKWLPLIVFGTILIRSVSGFFANYFMMKVGRFVIFDLRKDIFNNLIKLPTGFFDQNSSSKIVSKLIYDVEQTAVATTDTLTILAKDSVMIVALLGWMVFLNWQLTLLFLIALPVLAGLMSYANKRFRKTSKNIQGSMGNIANTVKEAVIGQKVVKVYNGQQQEQENFNQANQFNLKHNIKRGIVSSAVVPVTMLIVIGPVMSIILYVYLQQGTEATGEFFSYFTAFSMLTTPVKRIVKVNEKIQIGLTAANSAFNIVDAEPERDTGSIRLKASKGKLELKKVAFEYESEKGSVLENISFLVENGRRVALVGASGSGKSTITSLILRFYHTSSGDITLDGHSINDLALTDLRKQIALVSQETTLFDDTIRRNIVYGMAHEYDERKLQKAIKAAYVNEFVEKLPDGLDTQVGEYGTRLSGGQRQRIAIARAIYKDAPILILDEATSALDNKSERLVQKALETLMMGRSSLVIAHRLSTIENADEILVLKEGKIVERGTHTQLLKKNKVYAELYKLQFADKAKNV